MSGYWLRALTGRSPLQKTLRQHFNRVPLGEIVTAAREFPITSRVDLQRTLEEMFSTRAEAKLLGLHSPMNHETPRKTPLQGP